MLNFIPTFMLDLYAFNLNTISNYVNLNIQNVSFKKKLTEKQGNLKYFHSIWRVK